MRLRQVALVARDLEATVEELRTLFGIDVAFRDPGVAAFGLVNAVLPIGDTFLEVVSPTRDDASAARLLARRGGDTGYMVIVQIDDLAAARARMQREAVRIVFEHAHQDGHTATIHLHPRDVGGAILSLDESVPPESWDWAGRDWQQHVRRDSVTGIAAVELQSADPAALAARWGAVLDRPATRTATSAHEIRLDGGAIRFVAAGDGASEGIVGIDLVAADASRVGTECVSCGTRFRLVSPR